MTKKTMTEEQTGREYGEQPRPKVNPQGEERDEKPAPKVQPPPKKK